MILFDRVSFGYDANRETSLVLKEVSFSLKKGVVNGLLGKNGCGKSTIARLIVGLLTPSDGKISFIDEKENSFYHYFSGLIFQNPDNQIVGTTIGDDIAFGLESLNLDTNTINTSVKEAASLFNFEDMLEMPVSKLSGGQKQMLCIASIIAMKPNWIIFDEPTSHLDPWARKSFWDIVKKLINIGIGILVISQLPEDINHFNHIFVLNDGNLVFNDSYEIFKNLEKPPVGVDFPDGIKIKRLLNETVDRKS